MILKERGVRIQKEVIFKEQQQLVFNNPELSETSLAILKTNFSLNVLLNRINCDHNLGYRYKLFNRHSQLKLDCNKNLMFSIYNCPRDQTKKWFKLNCNSFFCEPCHIEHIKTTATHLKTNLMNANHRILVFTIPKELRNTLRWDQDKIIKLRHKHFKKCPICNDVFKKEIEFKQHLGYHYLGNNFKPLIDIVELPGEFNNLTEEEKIIVKINSLNARYNVEVELTDKISKFKSGVVKKTLDIYFKTYFHGFKKVDVGIMALTHTYGSLDLKWKPHENVFISNFGFVEYKEKDKASILDFFLEHRVFKKLRNIEKPKLDYDLKEAWRINKNLNYYQAETLFHKPKTFITYNYKNKSGKEITKKYLMISTSYIDIKKIRKIYKEQLKEVFGIKVENPVIHLDTELNDGDEFSNVIKDNNYRYGIPAKKLVTRLSDYYKRLPIKTSNLSQSFFSDPRYIFYTTYKRKQFVKLKRLPQKELYLHLNLEEFNKRILQHLPPNHFKNLRLWNLYHAVKEKRYALYYSIAKNKENLTKPLCPKCKTEMDLFCSVISGIIIHINQSVINKFNYKDLPSSKFLLLQELPGVLKPPDKLEYLSAYLKRQEGKIIKDKFEKIIALRKFKNLINTKEIEIDFNKGVTNITQESCKDCKRYCRNTKNFTTWKCDLHQSHSWDKLYFRREADDIGCSCFTEINAKEIIGKELEIPDFEEGITDITSTDIEELKKGFGHKTNDQVNHEYIPVKERR